MAEVVLLTGDDVLAGMLGDLVNPVATVNRFNLESAVAGLCHASFELALLDASVPDRLASVLARLFLHRNPSGRLAVVGARSGRNPVLDMAARDPRVAVFFDPVDHEAIRQWAYAVVESCMRESLPALR